VKLKLSDVLKAYQGIAAAQAFEKKLPGGFELDFSYCLVYNKQKLKPLFKTIEEFCAVDPGYQEYDKQRVSLAEAHALKDGDGRPVINDNNFQLKDKEEFKNAHEALCEKFKEEIEAQEQKEKKNVLFLEKEEEVEVRKIDMRLFPKNFPSSIMELLFDLVKED